jgi:phage-related protein
VLRWTVELTDVAKRELKALPDDIRVRLVYVSELLEEFGPTNVGLPHVRPLERKLWEMRVTGRDGIARAVYFAATGRKLTVVRIFVKKTRVTPRQEIDLALRRMSELRR